MARASLAVGILQVVYPVIVLVFFASAQAYATCFLPSTRSKSKTVSAAEGWRRGLLIGMTGLVLSHALDSIVFVLRLFLQKDWRAPESEVAFHLLSMLVWTIQLVRQLESHSDVWLSFYGSWVIGFTFELTIQILLVGSNVLTNTLAWLATAFAILRLCVLFGLSLGLYICLKRTDTKGSDEESQDLLKDQDDQQNKYGATDTSDSSSESDYHTENKSELFKKLLEAKGGWWAYAKSFSILLPYVVPTKSKKLQLRIVGVIVCLLGIRALNLLIPRQLGIITESLTTSNGKSPWILTINFEINSFTGTFPWREFCIFALLRLLQGSSTGITALQQILYQPVEQYAVSSVTQGAYNKIMDLSIDFHHSKQSGQLYRAISQGDQLASLVEDVGLTLVPMILDLILASWYFFHLFGGSMCLVLALTALIYFYSVTKLTSPLLKRRRPWLQSSRAQNARLVESIGNWETVSYFNRQDYEKSRYKEAYDKYLAAYMHYFYFATANNAIQEMIFLLGFLSAAFIAVYQVSTGSQTVGHFVTLLTYWATITAPMKYLGSLSRRLVGSLLDAEELVDLLLKEPLIQNKPSASPLQLSSGSVEFKGVDFAYDHRGPVLHNISFKAEGGQTVALVGETGGGKSTILKLLFRFYDAGKGAITIDGTNIQDVTFESLRDCFGVVPQCPVMFNDTIAANVRYAQDGCTDEEVREACKAAAIHDKIMKFKDGYDTVVGERGVKLSGGEVQRIAIARAIVKSSKIILLDEATSAIDAETEANIQIALTNLVKGRTTFLIAHRLSTIVNSDLILVVHGGKIVQAGNHDELFNLEGRYKQLWSNQILKLPRSKSDDQSQQRGNKDESDQSESKNLQRSKKWSSKGKTETDLQSTQSLNASTRENSSSGTEVSEDNQAVCRSEPKTVGQSPSPDAGSTSPGLNISSKESGDLRPEAQEESRKATDIDLKAQEEKPSGKAGSGVVKAPNDPGQLPRVTPSPQQQKQRPHVHDIVEALETKKQDGTQSGSPKATTIGPVGKLAKESLLKPDAPAFVPMKANESKPRSQSFGTGDESNAPRPSESNLTPTASTPKETWAQRRAREKKEKLAKKEEKIQTPPIVTTKDRLVKRSSSLFKRNKKPATTQSSSGEQLEGSSGSLVALSGTHTSSDPNNLDGAGDVEGVQRPLKKKRHRKRKNAATKAARKALEEAGGPNNNLNERVGSSSSLVSTFMDENGNAVPRPYDHLYPVKRRRALSKSDPLSTSVDGSTDEEPYLTQPMDTPNRHSSAPLAPSQGQRRRYHVQWKPHGSESSSGGYASASTGDVPIDDHSSTPFRQAVVAVAKKPALWSASPGPSNLSNAPPAASRSNVAREVRFAD
ncbi:MAG: hypothetical protein M1814_006777 [Vezdaea aestivalis]|nr:MAG: hypothetical protein M1814_006777 [Vezdaea aestivalis]